MALSSIMTRSLLSANSSRQIAGVQQNAKNRMDGHAGVLDAEIKLDGARGGDTKKKEEELEEIKKKSSALAQTTINTLTAASEDLKTAAKEDVELQRAEKAAEKKKAEKTAEKKKSEKKATEELLEKIGKDTMPEIGEDPNISTQGTTFEGATINVVVDSLTPSTGVTESIGEVVNKKV